MKAIHVWFFLLAKTCVHISLGSDTKKKKKEKDFFFFRGADLPLKNLFKVLEDVAPCPDPHTPRSDAIGCGCGGWYDGGSGGDEDDEDDTAERMMVVGSVMVVVVVVVVHWGD